MASDTNTPTAARRKLPIGIQTFRTIREEGCYYVDKTEHIRQLAGGGGRYFLSRPRRFGKSLLLDTMKELFEVAEPLFRGLAIHACWNWTVRHPVVRLSFGGGDFSNPDRLNGEVVAQLDAIAEDAAVTIRGDTASTRFRSLIRTLHRETGQRVVVLVDEYDKPILDVLSDSEAALANRNALRSIYGVIKDCDADIRFAFLTGVTKFTKVSLFSDLNNLGDITLAPDHATICGYTEHDLDTVFAPELSGLDREAIRDWYNGYGWLGDEKVYNPFDVLLLFDRRRFAAHWFETGSPSFLVETLTARGVSAVDLDGMVASEELLSTFDVDHMGTEALLFQGGYLTITAEETIGEKTFYRLGYPNREVRQSLNDSLLRTFAPEGAIRQGHGVFVFTACSKTTTSSAWRPSSGPSSPPFPTNATRATTSPTTRAITQACSMHT